MKRNFYVLSSVRALVALMLFNVLGLGDAKATYTPVTITSGYNVDVVANGTGAVNIVTNAPFDNDANEYVLMTAGFNNGTTTATSGLPASGLLMSASNAGLSYQMANFDSSNALQINTTNGSGTLVFGTPVTAGEIYLLASAGNGPATVDVTINFVSAPSQTITGVSIGDWYNGSGYAIFGLGRAARATNAISTDASNPRLYDVKLTVSASNWNNAISSITITRTSASGRLNVMGVSINDVCSGTPAGGTTVMTPGIVCPSTAFVLSTSGASSSVGQTYQWESTTSGAGVWTPIANATNATYNVSGGVVVATDFRLAITCTNTSTTGYSSTLTVTPAGALAGGTYTIDAGTPTGGTNFQNFTDAVAAIKCGIAGPVVFNVTTGTYNEQINIPVISGTSSTNTVTFNGNGATLAYSITASGSNYATLNLNGADYFTFKNLNIQAQGGTYGFAVHLMGGADYNTFDSCTISANANATATTSGAVSMSNSTSSYSSSGANGSNNTFSNCTVSGGYFGFYLYGASNTGNANNSIINCTVQNFYVYGIYNYYQTGASIAHNIVERPTRTSVSTFYGIYLSTGCNNMTVDGNTLRSFSGATANSSLSAYIIYVTAAASLNNENKIINNLIYNTNHTGLAYGLYFSGGTYLKAYHNTVSIDNASALSGTVYGIYSSGTAGVDIKNNIVSVTRGGTGTKYCLYFSGAGKTSDYNNLYMASTTGTNNIGYYSGAFATLAAWQTANSGAYDQHSLALNPMFVNSAAGDFTPSNSLMDDLGTPVGVTTDLNGATRNLTTPDMGAIEFSVPLCSGTPTAGTASGPSGACANQSFSLTLSGFTIGNGISIQWESSPAGAGTWTQLTNATSSTYTETAGITSATDYRAVVTCNNGGSFDISNVVTLNMNPFLLCYCVPTYASGGSTDNITNVQLGTLSNNTASAGNPVPYYQDYTSQQPGTLAIPDLTQGVSYNVTVSFGSDGNQYSRVWFDWDQSGTFDTSESFSLGTNAGGNGTAIIPIVVPISATPGLTRMRIRGGDDSQPNSTQACGASSSSYGEAEDYLVNILMTSACTGTPVAGTAYGPTGNSACPNAAFTLTDTAFTTGIGISYQWEESPSGAGSFTAISGATNPVYTVTAGITAATDYRLVVTCSNGGSFDYSNVVTITVNTFYNCYCTSTATSSGDEEILNVTFGSLNNSSTCSTTAPGAGSVINQYSNYTSVPAPQVMQGASVGFSVQIGTCGGNYGNWTKIFIDYDQDGTFTGPNEEVYSSPSSTTGPHTESGSITIPISALPGLTGMRVVNVETSSSTGVNPCGTYSWGETEDYLIDIQLTSACTGTPSAGTAFGPDSVCANVTFTLTDTAATVAAGITYQWESSAYNANTWAPISGATNPIYIVSGGITAPTDYRLVVTCANSSQTSTSNIVSVSGIYPAAQCYCIPVSTSTLYGIDAFSTTGALLNINNSGTGLSTGGYGNFTSQIVSANPSTAINFSTNFISGTNGFAIWVDWGQDGSFAEPGDLVYNTTSYMASPLSGSFTVPVTAISGNTRMRIVSNYLNSNPSADYCSSSNNAYAEWEDYTFNVPVLLPCTGTPAAGTAYGPSTACSGLAFTLVDTAFSYGNGIAYQWQSSPAGANTWTNIFGATGTTYTETLGITSATDYRMYVTCSFSGGSDTSNVVAMTTITTAPWTYNVETQPANSGTGALAECWAASPTPSTTYSWWVSASGTTPSSGTGPLTAHSGTHFFYTEASYGSSGNTAELTTPFVDVSTLANPQLDFWYHMFGPDIVSLHISASANGTTWTVIDSLIGQQQTTQAGAWMQKTIPLTGYNSSVFIKFTGTRGTSFGGDISLDDISITGTPLSADLLKLTATNVDQRNRIDWTTGSERDMDHFELERSVDGHFVKLADISAKGQSSAYSYWDEKPVTGINYYRLKMVDASGHYTYSRTVSAVVAQGSIFVQAYPNPVKETLTVKITGTPDKDATVRITDITGKVLRSFTMEQNQKQIDMNGLAQGVYLVEYHDASYSQIIRVTKN